MVVPGVLGLHTNAAYWGPEDPMVWRPSRWIVNPVPVPVPSPSAPRLPSPAPALGDESLRTPPPGAFVAWSAGPRVCPGKKLSQVEVVAVLARLFATCVVEPVSENGETGACARERTMRTVADGEMRILLQMRAPEAVAVRWKARDGPFPR